MRLKLALYLAVLFSYVAAAQDPDPQISSDFQPKKFSPLMNYKYRRFSNTYYDSDHVKSRNDANQDTSLQIHVPVPLKFEKTESTVVLLSDLTYYLGDRTDDFSDASGLMFTGFFIQRVPGEDYSILAAAGFIRKDFTKHMLNHFYGGVLWKHKVLFDRFILKQAVFRVRNINHRQDYLPIISGYYDLGSKWYLITYFPQELSLTKYTNNWAYQVGIRGEQVSNMIFDHHGEDYWLGGTSAFTFANISHNIKSSLIWATLEIGSGAEQVKVYDNNGEHVNTRLTTFPYYLQLAVRALD